MTELEHNVLLFISKKLENLNENTIWTDIVEIQEAFDFYCILMQES